MPAGILGVNFLGGLKSRTKKNKAEEFTEKKLAIKSRWEIRRQFSQNPLGPKKHSPQIALQNFGQDK